LSRESFIFQSLPDSFPRKIADRVRLLAESGSQVLGFLTPALTAQSENQPPRFDNISLTTSARQVGNADLEEPRSFCDERNSVPGTDANANVIKRTSTNNHLHYSG